VIGTVITVLFGGDPGFMLGFFVVIATLAASFAVEPRAVYRILPAPVLSYLVGAIIAGLIHDRATDTSRTALALSAAQWVAHGFVAMTAATVLVALIAAVRWGRLWRRYGTVSRAKAFGPRTAAGLRSSGGQHSAGGASGATSPNGTSSRRGPAGPRASARGGDRLRGTPPPGLGH
jgi:hypothetical protein